MPRTTVLLPVHNGASFLDEALNSVLAQTDRDFELLVIDDASTDNSLHIAEACRDPRLRVLRNATRQGLAATLNRGLRESDSEFVARMDADDVCLPKRLHTQRTFMEAHPDVGVCGSWVRYFGKGRPFTARYPTGPENIRAYVLFANPLAHAAVFMRRTTLEAFGVAYDESVPVAQDYRLWAQCVRQFPVDNIPHVLLRYRVHEAGATGSRFQESETRAAAVSREELARLGLEVSEENLAFHRQVGMGRGAATLEDLARALHWLQRILAANDEKKAYSPDGLRYACGFVWFRHCLNSASLGRAVGSVYRSAPFSRGYRPAPAETALFLLKTTTTLAGSSKEKRVP